MRILTNYFQILTLASSYDLSWTDNMKAFLTYFSIITQSSQIIFSVDCFLRDNKINTEPVYFKMILACLFPLICIGVVSVVWAIFGYWNSRKAQINQFQGGSPTGSEELSSSSKSEDRTPRGKVSTWTKLIMSVIILIFMTLPTVTTITFAIYNCVDVFGDGDSYLAVDMSLQCWTGDH